MATPLRLATQHGESGDDIVTRCPTATQPYRRTRNDKSPALAPHDGASVSRTVRARAGNGF